ncbi:MAG: hypothetical protein SVW57_06195 [Thermodesulfobacteriota bacterium]|nr:hypothetical protein [Thermodesulfobacteriota bacterium]
MRKELTSAFLAGVFLLTTAIPITVSAGQGGTVKGKALQVKTQSKNQVRTRHRLQDGSCVKVQTKKQVKVQQQLQDGPYKKATKAQSGKIQKKGKAYGPGDGTGNQGIGPKDGTGYGTLQE